MNTHKKRDRKSYQNKQLFSSEALDQVVKTSDTDDDPNDLDYKDNESDNMSIESMTVEEDFIDEEELIELKQGPQNNNQLLSQVGDTITNHIQKTGTVSSHYQSQMGEASDKSMNGTHWANEVTDVDDLGLSSGVRTRTSPFNNNN